MAIIWEKNISNVQYEVRNAGNSLRLYTDGVFHTQYNPTQPLTGQVWDLLMLPAFFAPHKIKRVLVLGVGGGAVIQMLRHFVSPEKIVGIELNPVHLFVARRFFKLKHCSIKLIEADAVQWLKNYNGPRFDMIIDDLFFEEDGEPVAVTKANRQWFTLLLKNLQKEGVLVRNFVSRKELLESAGLTNVTIQKQFSSVFQIGNDCNENLVGAYLRSSSSSATLRKNLMNTPGLNPTLKTSRLNYRIRRLS